MSDSIIYSGSYFVGWGTLALINTAIAQSKGRGGLIWFFISLFLGPIATFLLVILPELRRSSHRYD